MVAFECKDAWHRVKHVPAAGLLEGAATKGRRRARDDWERLEDGRESGTSVRGRKFYFRGAAERMDQPGVSAISDPRPPIASHITQAAAPSPRLPPMSILAVAIAAISLPRAGSPSPPPSPLPAPDAHVTRHNEYLAVLLPKHLWKVRPFSWLISLT